MEASCAVVYRLGFCSPLTLSSNHSPMHTLISIKVDDSSGNIRVTTQEIEKPHGFDLVLEKDASIVELLKPFLDASWSPISRLVRPDGIVVKLVEINKACSELYCHLLNRDWPLVELNISPLGDISERDALNMAASYYKHLDLHTPSLLKQPLVAFPNQLQYSKATQTLLKRNAKITFRRHPLAPIELKLQQKDLKRLDWSSLIYLIRRSTIENVSLAGQFKEETMVRFLPKLSDVPLTCLKVEDKISTKCISILSDVVWQNLSLYTLHLDRSNVPTFLNLESSANFFPLIPPLCTINSDKSSSRHAEIEYAMKEMKSRHVIASDDSGHLKDWVKRCPSLILTTTLECSAESLVGVAHKLTQLENLTLYESDEDHSTGSMVFPPNLCKLEMEFSMPRHRIWKKHVFPPSLQKLELEITDPRRIPIDLVFEPLTDLTRLEKLDISDVCLEEPKSCFPELKHWCHLKKLGLRVATVKMVHCILASVPTTQWEKLELVIEEDKPGRPGMFEGLEDADWGNLKTLQMDFVDFVIHSEMLKQFHQLTKLSVKRVSDASLLCSRMQEVLNPDIHTHLQFIECTRSGSRPWKDAKLSAELVAEWQRWPNLRGFPGSDKKQAIRNCIRQTELTELAVHPMFLQ